MPNPSQPRPQSPHPQPRPGQAAKPSADARKDAGPIRAGKARSGSIRLIVDENWW